MLVPWRVTNFYPPQQKTEGTFPQFAGPSVPLGVRGLMEEPDQLEEPPMEAADTKRMCPSFPVIYLLGN